MTPGRVVVDYCGIIVYLLWNYYGALCFCGWLLCIIVSCGVAFAESMCFEASYCVLLWVVVWPGPIFVCFGSRDNWLKPFIALFLVFV